MKNLIWLLPLFLFSCFPEPQEEPPFEVIGMKPIYLDGALYDQITVEENRPIKNLGKIYYKDNHIFVNEVNKGVHIIDNMDPYNPTPVKFIQIWGSKDIAIKGSILYADNVTDLVAIDISDLDNIVVTKRIPGLYGDGQKDYPENSFGPFECVDNSKGIVIGWESALLQSPECSR